MLKSQHVLAPIQQPDILMTVCLLRGSLCGRHLQSLTSETLVVCLADRSSANVQSALTSRPVCLPACSYAGAGVAALLALHYRARYTSVRAWCFAPPGGLMSPAAAASLKDICYSLVSAKVRLGWADLICVQQQGCCRVLSFRRIMHSCCHLGV